MVATVRNLTSSSATSEYFRQEGGYYIGAGEDAADLRAKRAEHRRSSAWHGKGASALGLRPGGEVAAGIFEKLLQGRVVGTDIRLGRLRDGAHEHRPGFDITFSAPKSVSLAALLPTERRPRGDRAALRAHDEAVRATLDWIEETMLQTRGWDPARRTRPRVSSPTMVAALFRHIASRNRDPQLHTHAVVANMTRGADGRWRSVEPTLLHRNARLIGAYYRNELARRLIAVGYSIAPAMAGRLPSFEIAGYGRALRETFSTRRREILAYAAGKGWDLTSAALQRATLATRRRKSEPERAKLQRSWLARARAAGFGDVGRPAGLAEAPAAPAALEIVGRAMARLEERQPVFAAAELEALALAHSPGRHTIGAIREAVSWMERDGHLVKAALSRADRSFTTDRALNAEREVIASMKAGIGAAGRLAGKRRVEARLAGSALTPGQRDAVRAILLSDDRIVGVQGRAGTGKTTMLRHVRELAAGRRTIGLAPSSSATRVLERETDIHARPLQWFLTRCGALDGDAPADARLREMFGGAIVVLDEASMVSTEQMRSLTRIAEKLDVARLVLVGDRSQLRAVEAGQPFRLLQEAGMTTARMDDLLRQRNPELRAAVLSVLAGDPGEAVELLGAGVHEAGYDELGRKAAECWLALDAKTRDNTLLLAPTHALREDIHATLRDALAAEGVLRGRTLKIERLVNLGMTRADKGDARNYREGDLVVFRQDLVNYRVRKDEVLAVSGIEHDTVVLAHPDGTARRIRPAGGVRYRLEVYETREIELRAGDRIRWTRNDTARALINGEKAEVLEIARGRVRFALADGRNVALGTDDPQLRHIDHAWSSTVYGAQGSTADRVIAVLDSSHRALTDQATFYVEISRARDGAEILTDNLEQLVEVLAAATGERPTALEAAGERIAPYMATLAPAKKPAWTPLEEWRALEEKARGRGTVLFLMDEYAALVESARELAGTPDLEAGTREFADGLLAYDRACREEDKAAEEFLGLLDGHAERRRALDAAGEAAGRAVAGQAGYGAWRGMAERLAANGREVLAHPTARPGGGADAIAARLDALTTLTGLDDAVLGFETLRAEVSARARAAGTVDDRADGHGELVRRAAALLSLAGTPAWARTAAETMLADTETAARRRARIEALARTTVRFGDERRDLERAAGRRPPTLLPAHAGWLDECGEAEHEWRAMQDDPAVWRPRLVAPKDETAEIEAALARFEELRGHDAAWTKLHETRVSIYEEAQALGVEPFYREEWAAFAGQARALADREGVPDGARRAAERVLEYDRLRREERDAVATVVEGGERHGAFWQALRAEAAGRAGRDGEVPTAELAGYRPLDASERALLDTAVTIRKNEDRYGRHLDRIRDGRAAVDRAAERLGAHALADRYAGAIESLRKAERGAVGRGVALSADETCAAARREAARLAERDDLEEAARGRLAAELAALADRASFWRELLGSANELETLDREREELGAEAARQDIPRPLLAEWRDWEERARVFADNARWALHDRGLLAEWRDLTDLPERIGAGIERAGAGLPASEEARLEAMLRAETARLRDPEAGHRYDRDWWGQEPLAVGDRIALAQWRGGAGRKAAVIWPGADGGIAPRGRVTLEWSGREEEAAVETVAAAELAASGVRRASWTDERPRDAALTRDPLYSPHFPLVCGADLAVGDRVRWTEAVATDRPAPPGRPAAAGRGGAATVEAVVVERRAAGRTEEDDRVTLRETWRSDGRTLRRVEMPLAKSMADRAMRAFWNDEGEREREARERAEALRREREEIARREREEIARRERRMAMSMAIRR